MKYELTFLGTHFKKYWLRSSKNKQFLDNNLKAINSYINETTGLIKKIKNTFQSKYDL
jgi:hypothetical protein